MTGQSTKEQIIQVADDLFYRQGYAKTSFANIAQAVQISRGNFYHHFKTKDQILDAVIGLRLNRTRQMLDDWEEGVSPQKRIERFIGILIMNRAKIARFGCPVGSLCTELSKLEHSAQDKANKLFEMFQDWLQRQFVLAGRGDDAETLSKRLLAHSQGVATLAQAFEDEAYIDQEVDHLNAWLHDELERGTEGKESDQCI
ncbi:MULTISPECIES: TetR/AcrR family transcriptional regulator [unclassified Ruegeria]|uniref:TetR/AcrR family transcriptional regulator n=1 Tax=unclassified Ruegeria TaxID=2625375 RepID=UPI001488AAB1|nr:MULTISPECIES: TetR/AcrR family transcriptional regulator [unclassified Ruegeria]